MCNLYRRNAPPKCRHHECWGVYFIQRQLVVESLGRMLLDGQEEFIVQNRGSKYVNMLKRYLKGGQA